MLVLKGCPRCHGDLMLVTYMEGRSTNCLQCGFSRELPPAHKAEPERRPLLFDDEPRPMRPVRNRRPRLAPLPSRGA